MTYTIQLPISSNIRRKNVSYRYPGDIEVGYTILNYTPENPDSTIYRSVILDTNTQVPVSFSPVKSIPFTEFAEKYPTLSEDIQITEMAEGTMINLFYDNTVEKWQIATKSAVGGHYWYFNQNPPGVSNTVTSNTTISNTVISNTVISKTFRKMFYDALRAEYATPLSDIPFISDLNKNVVYSFVLQHPENHLVFRIDHPRLILVSMFLIVKNSGREAEGVRGNSGERSSKEFAPTHTENTYHVELIPQYDFTNIVPELPMYSGMVNAPDNIFCNEIQSTSALVHLKFGNKKGVVITNTRTGERTKLDNPEYLKRKELRGNHPHLHYQYLALVHMGKVHEFLHYFPMYSHMFRQFYTQYQTFITDVHQAYVSYYIHRNTDTQLPKRHFIHAARIHHSIYIPSLSTAQKTVIKRKVVQEYFSKMDPREILFSMYYHEPK